MNEIEEIFDECFFNEEDIYCIEHFGYNTNENVEDLKSRENKEHLIFEELEYRLSQANIKLEKIKKCIEDN